MTDDDAYEPPTVEDLGTLEDLTGSNPLGTGMNETIIHGTDKTG